MTLKFGMQHRVLEYCPGLILNFFTAMSDLVPYAFVRKKVKIMDFSETIVVYDIKIGRCSQLNEYMKLYENQRSRSFIDLGPDHSDSNFLNFFPQQPLILYYPQHSDERYRTNGPLVFKITWWTSAGKQQASWFSLVLFYFILS